jgi:hypothetical protein
MPDTYDTAVSDPNSLPPLTRAIFEAYPKTMAGNTIGPTAGDRPLRAMSGERLCRQDRSPFQGDRGRFATRAATVA